VNDEEDHIDCQEALEELYDYLDGELTPDRAEEVRRHLHACAPCLAVSDFEAAFLRFIEARTKGACAPEELRRRILEQTLFETGDSDST